MPAIQLNHDAASALLEEARRDFNNGARELWTNNDKSQRLVIEACTEIIGRLDWEVERWPQEKSAFGGSIDKAVVEFEFTPQVLDWVERSRVSQAGYVADLDAGVNDSEPGYIAGQVYLLHVLNSIAEQRGEAVAA